MKPQCLAAILLLAGVAAPGAKSPAAKRVLVYTRNFNPDGKGYVHDNIAASVAAVRKMGVENGFEVDVSDDPQVFDSSKLRQYGAIVFSNSNNEAFANDLQRRAFRSYIENGG